MADMLLDVAEKPHTEILYPFANQTFGVISMLQDKLLASTSGMEVHYHTRYSKENPFTKSNGARN